MSARFLRFLGVGVLNTLFGYSVYAVLVYWGILPSYALLVATVLGVIFNFYTSKHLVFKDFQGKFLRFVLSYAVIYVFNVALLNIALHFITASAYFAQILSLPPTVIFTYFILKNFSFQKRFAHAEEAH